MTPSFSGEAMLIRVAASGEARFVLDDPERLRARVAQSGRSSLRFMMVLVEIGDDENLEARPPTDPALMYGILDTARSVFDRVSDRHASNQCALLCKSPAFGWFMYSRRHGQTNGVMPCPPEYMVVDWLKQEMSIGSRAELDSDCDTAARWGRMMREYRLWIDEEISEVRKLQAG